MLIISKSHKNYYGTRKYFVARELNPNVKINRHETKIFFFRIENLGMELRRYSELSMGASDKPLHS